MCFLRFWLIPYGVGMFFNFHAASVAALAAGDFVALIQTEAAAFLRLNLVRFVVTFRACAKP